MPDSDLILHLAYGSNMSPSQLVGRIGPLPSLTSNPNANPIRVRLANYRLAFNKQSQRSPENGFANIMPEAGSEVWGVMFAITAEQLSQLDDYEGVDSGHYHHETVVVLDDEDNQHSVIAYVANDDRVVEGLIPTQIYLQTVLEGAKQGGLPESYLNQILLIANR